MVVLKEKKNYNLTILLSSRGFTSLHFLFSLVSPYISTNMVAMKKRKRRFILLLGLYIFLYILVKHVVDIQALLLQGE